MCRDTSVPCLFATTIFLYALHWHIRAKFDLLYITTFLFSYFTFLFCFFISGIHCHYDRSCILLLIYDQVYLYTTTTIHFGCNSFLVARSVCYLFFFSDSLAEIFRTEAVKILVFEYIINALGMLNRNVNHKLFS